jgi:hypothetical protein
MKTINARLFRLEAALKPRPGCDRCRTWNQRHIVICDEAGNCTRPSECTGCGRVVPYAEVRVFVGIDIGAV